MHRMLESVQDFNFRFAIQTKLQRFLMIKNARLTGTVYGNVFCQFPFRWIYYYGSNNSTGKETGKMHLYAAGCFSKFCVFTYKFALVFPSFVYQFSLNA